MTAHPSPAPRSLPHRALFGALILALALAAAACGGNGGPSNSGKTSTAAAGSAAATATQAAIDGPPPVAADIAGFITAGFNGLDIPYGATDIPSFEKSDILLSVLDSCDKGKAGGPATDSPDYWAQVLGDCYTVGNALGWLYQYTGRKDFLYANLLMRRFNRQKFEQAVAGGATVNEDYWKLVSDKIYAVTPVSTPIAVTPLPAAATPAEH
jgi:hypothetical protein